MFYILCAAIYTIDRFIINVFIAIFTSTEEIFEDDFLVQCWKKRGMLFLLLSRPKKLFFALLYHSKSWGFGIRLSQQLVFQIPVGTIWEASKARGRPGLSSGFPRTLIHPVSLWDHLSQVTERCVYLSPLPDCELVVKISLGHFIEPEKVKLDKIDFRGLSCQIRDWGAKNWNQEHRDLTF